MHRNKVTQRVLAGESPYIQGDLLQQARHLGEDEIDHLVAGASSNPTVRKGTLGKLLMHTYYCFCWIDVFSLIDLPATGTIIEVAPGPNPVVALALDRHSSGRGRYIAANMNQQLTATLRKRLAPLAIDTQIIEDDAAKLSSYLPAKSADAACFNHAVNDMFEYLAAKDRGKDTVNLDWEASYGDLINGLETVYHAGKLESVVKSGFLSAIAATTAAVKPKGNLVLNNYVFQEQLDLGGSLELYGAFIPIVRAWIKETDLQLEETELKEFDTQYWLALTTREQP